MKKTIALIAILSCFAAHATQPIVGGGGGGSNNNNTGGVGVGIGLAGAAAASSASSIAGGGSAIASGGLGGAGGSIGNVYAGGVNMGGARIGSDVNVERSAPSVFGASPTQATQPCARPGFSIGGSSTGGGGLISLPTGTDVTCRVDNALTIMGRNPALFTAEDRLRVSCKQEDIAETRTCKELERRDQAASNGSAPVATKRQPMPWQAGG